MISNLTEIELKVMNNLSEVIKPDIHLGSILQEIINLQIIRPGTPTNSNKATATLSITGDVKDSEKFSIFRLTGGISNIYEFCSDAEQTLANPTYIPVNIEEYTTKATGTLTLDTQPTVNDTMKVGSKTFTFVLVPDFLSEIAIGDMLSDTQANIVKAINGVDPPYNGTPNIVLSCGDFINDISTITSLRGSTISNSIPLTETFTAPTNIFSGSTLLGGTDCSASNAIIALLEAIIENDTVGVDALSGENDSIIITAKDYGEEGNDIKIEEFMSNVSLSPNPKFLEGGEIGDDLGYNYEGYILYDSNYLYISTEVNAYAGIVWQRITLGSAY